MYAYGYSLSKKPHATFYRVDPEGNPAGVWLLEHL